MKKKLDPYETLGVGRDVNPEQIKAAHRKRVRKAHPDAGGNKDEFLAVQRSYEILSDDEARKRFDQTGNTDEPPNIQNRALSELLRLAVMVVTEARDPKTIDLVAAMRKSIQMAMEQQRRNREGALAQVEKFEDAAKRFKIGKGKENPIEVIMRQQVQNARSSVTSCDDMLEMMETALKILADYKYDWSKPDEMFTGGKAMWANIEFVAGGKFT